MEAFIYGPRQRFLALIKRMETPVRKRFTVSLISNVMEVNFIFVQ